MINGYLFFETDRSHEREMKNLRRKVVVLRQLEPAA